MARWLFSFRRRRAFNSNRKPTRMNCNGDLSPEDLKRLPGLYRRWELTEVFKPHRNYQIEDAGAHADGTPLLAIYVSDPVPDASAPPTISTSHHPEERKAG